MREIALAIHPTFITHLAAATGTLELKGVCLVLERKNGPTMGLAWPPGTHWDQGRDALILLGVAMPLGSEVKLAGGAYELDMAAVGAMPWITPPRAECLTDVFWIAGNGEVVTNN